MKKSLYWLALLWLKFWARLVLGRVKPYIIGVTGSAGKSSAVAAMNPVIKLKFPRLKVAGKANSESGIPADILGLHFGESPSPIADWIRICFFAPLRALHSVFSIQHSVFDCYLVEMGVDEPAPPKNMGYLLTILQPDMGVILNVLPVHTQQFGSVAKIAKEKGKLIAENPNLKLAILNADQPGINSLKPTADGIKTLTFGINSKADIIILSIKPSLEGTEISLQYNKQKYFIKLNRLALPDFYGYTFAAAFAVGISLDLNPAAITDAISTGFVLPPGRGQIFAGIKGSTIIDSSYNASRETMIGSLRLLKTVPGKRRKIAVLGDMRELGNQAEKEHLAVAKTILETADQAVLVGPLMRKFVFPYLENHGFQTQWFPTAGYAAKFLLESSPRRGGANLQDGEVILVKGSQNTIFPEIIVEALLSNKEDIEKLCRRGKFWDRQRRPFKL
ncbi:MAG: UDP-N-acetylmuramoyl-tripeptide-D-alanyl-D-alanine ligase [Candidatus Magasanikbacteria bacterium GW2011_GWA2_45_39]|uniref:UDP-N-acetylmuramoyl-tripeptide-D-alanyl-D-alanine ligase n=1 Tax=Candidatus Magasanikbacteria bacterium GW2011_GWA2_45_39 TaxID=1619041 RepID=A0A0G1MEV8_9BACT|nr:MAG: UDP-N-acetylmuramoyl-tripeptide-D-alanyl-D-alanine ligase [Candidatus Magasanikbacteria bacterium GW2011_GWA2_45_39]